MDNLDYLKEINETEKKAESIIVKARTLREEKEKQTAIKAEKIKAKAAEAGEIMYKSSVNETKVKGENLLSEAEKKAREEADLMEKQSAFNFDDAVRNVAEGIVKICVDR